jgi:hypothetical protein
VVTAFKSTRGLAVVLGLLTSIGCASRGAHPKLRSGASLDEAVARARLDRFRANYLANQATVQRCERRSRDRCERGGKCHSYIDFSVLRGFLVPHVQRFGEHTPRTHDLERHVCDVPRRLD